MSSRALVRSTRDQIIDFPSEISSRKSASMTFPSVSSHVPGRFPLGSPLRISLRAPGKSSSGEFPSERAGQSERAAELLCACRGGLGSASLPWAAHLLLNTGLVREILMGLLREIGPGRGTRRWEKSWNRTFWMRFLTESR